MNLRPLITLSLVLSLYVLAASLPLQANALTPNDILITLTKTRTLSAGNVGPIQVAFNFVSLDQTSPQSYSFGIMARTTSGVSITQLSWQFGDGSSIDVPYCCQSWVSEVRFHAYTQPGMYTVSVTVYDNLGNTGVAQVNVNWVPPVPSGPTP